MHVSSNTTLFFKMFVPTLWFSFFGSMTIAYWFAENLPALLPMSPPLFRITLTAFFVLSLVFMFFTFFRLMRVEMYQEHFTVSDFWTTYRFKWPNVISIKTSNYGLFSVARIQLKDGGTLGKKVVFLPSKARFQYFFQDRPDLAHLVKK